METLTSQKENDCESAASNKDSQLVDLDRVRIDPAWARRVPLAVAMRTRSLPLCQVGDQVVVATDRQDGRLSGTLDRYIDKPLKSVVVSGDSLDAALESLVALNPSKRTSPVKLLGHASSGDAVTVCDEILAAAAIRSASDIHLRPSETKVDCLLRVDGQLEDYAVYSRDEYTSIVSRLKVLAGLDIAEKRVPQDGRYTLKIAGDAPVDLRVATLPTRHGERLTIRLFVPPDSDSLAALGMNVRQVKSVEVAIESPHGLILLTGPTGCGKSTTLHIAIQQTLQSQGGNIVTVEDPIEYEMPEVTQVEVDAADKLNFSKALRSILRHDPDVLMIGEIRDRETAEVAIKAALTGHLVFSTLHTNNAVGVVSRLSELGIEPFLVAETLKISVAQRLVRQLCSKCRKPRQLRDSEAEHLGKPELAGSDIFEPVGCLYCGGRGYSGRTGLFELLDFDRGASSMIAECATNADLLQYMRRTDQPMLLDAGIEKLLAGETTLREVLANTSRW